MTVQINKGFIGYQGTCSRKISSSQVQPFMIHPVRRLSTRSKNNTAVRRFRGR